MLTGLVISTSGIGDMLKSDEVRSVIDDLAQQVAARVSAGPGVDVVVDSYTTDRAAAAVIIAHPKGMLLQARDGVLTRAAASLGLEVRERT